MPLDPAREAQKVLEKVWGDRGFPIDPVTIAKELGVQVYDTELPNEVSGALIKEAGKDPIIALHFDDHRNRKRFSCSHELGHYVSRIESSDDSPEYEYIDLRGQLAANGTDEEEIFANRFAANLLMPENVVRKLDKDGKSHFEMAMFFGVSTESLKFRLKNLGLL